VGEEDLITGISRGIREIIEGEEGGKCLQCLIKYNYIFYLAFKVLILVNDSFNSLYYKNN